MKQHKEKQDSQSLTEWNPSVSNMNAITLRVLHLIRECLNYDGTWQEKNSKEKR